MGFPQRIGRSPTAGDFQRVVDVRDRLWIFSQPGQNFRQQQMDVLPLGGVGIGNLFQQMLVARRRWPVPLS